jgi:hypothetical protein
MTYTCNEVQFLKDVAQHQMHILKDDGLYRHVRFKAPGTMMEHFDLITWPGYLCYTGDMGTYVFERLADMFEFFSKEPGRLFQIDMRYWAEKVQAGDRMGRSEDGIYEWDEDAFRREMTEQRRRLIIQHGRGMAPEERPDLWEAIGEVIDAAEEGQDRAMIAMHDFHYSYLPAGKYSDRQYVHFDTDDFPRCQKYTNRFRWCCYALAWGINQYNEEKQKATEVTA